MSERMNFAAFWPQYLSAHRDPRTRAFHYLGTILGVCSFVVFLITMSWQFLLAAPILGYGLAMLAHPIFEDNRPKTFEHPALSFISNFYMLFLWATGRLGPELAQLPSSGGKGDRGLHWVESLVGRREPMPSPAAPRPSASAPSATVNGRR